MKSGILMPNGDLITFASITSVEAFEYPKGASAVPTSKGVSLVVRFGDLDCKVSPFDSLEAAEAERDRIISEWAAWDSPVEPQSTAKLVTDPTSGPLDRGNDHISPVAFLMGGPPWGKNP